MPKLSKDFLTFLIELPNNNNREWFAENKKRFTESVQNPFEEFVQQLILKLEKTEPALKGQNAKDCVFRIYRDVRFSADKSPYKNYVSALISAGGKKNKTFPGAYLQASAEDVRLYSGSHELDKDQLLAVRNKILKEQDRFKKCVDDKAFVETFGSVLGDKNKKLSPEFAAIEKAVPLIANKSFYYFKKFPPSQILKEDFPDTLVKVYKAASPINKFLSEALS